MRTLALERFLFILFLPRANPKPPTGTTTHGDNNTHRNMDGTWDGGRGTAVTSYLASAWPAI